jgi:hypothetical protein
MHDQRVEIMLDMIKRHHNKHPRTLEKNSLVLASGERERATKSFLSTLSLIACVKFQMMPLKRQKEHFSYAHIIFICDGVRNYERRRESERLPTVLMS